MSVSRKNAFVRAERPLSKAEQMRVDLIETAIDLLATHGLESTTLHSIGKPHGLSRSHVAYYFKSKAELCEACIQVVSRTGQDITAEQVSLATTLEEKLAGAVRGAFIWAERHPRHLAVMILFYHLCTHDQGLREFHSSIRDLGRERLAGLLGAIAKVAGKKGHNAEPLARAIQAVISGLLFEKAAVGRKISAAKAADEAIRFAMICVAALE